MQQAVIVSDLHGVPSWGCVNAVPVLVKWVWIAAGASPQRGGAPGGLVLPDVCVFDKAAIGAVGTDRVEIEPELSVDDLILDEHEARAVRRPRWVRGPFEAIGGDGWVVGEV